MLALIEKISKQRTLKISYSFYSLKQKIHRFNTLSNESQTIIRYQETWPRSNRACTNTEVLVNALTKAFLMHQNHPQRLCLRALKKTLRLNPRVQIDLPGLLASSTDGTSSLTVVDCLSPRSFGYSLRDFPTTPTTTYNIVAIVDVSTDIIYSTNVAAITSCTRNHDCLCLTFMDDLLGPCSGVPVMATIVSSGSATTS